MTHSLAGAERYVFPRIWEPYQKASKLELVEYKVGNLAKYSTDTTNIHTGNVGRYKGLIRPHTKGAFLSHRDWFGDFDSFSSQKERETLTPLQLGTLCLDRGWKAGADKVAELSVQVAGILAPEDFGRRKRKFSTEGDELDLDRFQARHSSPWVDFDRSGRKPSRYLTLVAQNGGNCGISTEEMFWNGAVGVVVCDALEEAGFRVRLIGSSLNCQGTAVSIWNGSGFGATEHTGYMLMNFIVKDFDEPLRFAPAAAVLCHAGVFRTVQFTTICQSAYKVSGGLGSCCPLESLFDGTVASNVRQTHAPDFAEQIFGARAVILPQCYSKEAAQQALRTVRETIQTTLDLVSV